MVSEVFDADIIAQRREFMRKIKFSNNMDFIKDLPTLVDFSSAVEKLRSILRRMFHSFWRTSTVR
jgi:hypothetical protein